MNTSKWLPALTSLIVLAMGLSAPAQAQYNQTRTSSFTYYGASDGAKNGLMKTETVEPGNPQLCVTTTYDYDVYGNKTSATTANCSGATGAALFTSRGSTSAYAAQAVTVAGTSLTIPAGTFATTATNALSQSEGRTYDPRFGAVRTLTGPNALATTWEVDDFGRKTREIRADGTRTVSYYCFISGRVTDITSNTVGCPTPAASEIPTEAIAFVHSESRDNSGTVGVKNGPFKRTYTDRAGRSIRSVTEAFDGPSQPGGSSRLVVQDTDYSPYGPQTVATQPYFLDTGASASTGSNNYGMSRTEYDALGRPIAVYVADPTGSQTSGAATNFGSRGTRRVAQTTIAYNGLTTTTTNDKGQVRQEEKNVDGNVVRVTDALGAQVAYQHDAFENLLITKDALQNQVVVAYDTRGRKTSLTDPDAGVVGYCYDALGQLVAQQSSTMRGGNTLAACPASPNTGTTANAVTGWTTMAYDKLGRITSRAEPEYVSTWTYDKYADNSACTKGIGKLCQSSTSNGVNRKIVYDSLGRPINTRTTITSGPSFASAIGYDAVHGRTNSQTYPTGLKVNYNYTAKGFLSTLTLATSATVTPRPATPGGTPGAGTTLSAGAMLWRGDAYNAWGRAEQQTYGNSVVSKAVFEAFTGQVTASTAGVGASTNVFNHGYVWNSLGQLTQRNDANGDGNTGAVSDSFVYDSIGRLQSYTVSAPAIPNLQRTVTLQYNALGMLLYKSDVGNYTYGSQGPTSVRPHALQSVAGAVTAGYTYDANGNLTAASAGKYRTVAYTSFNLPDSNAGAQGPSGSPKYTWTYDENHQRIKEIEVSATGTRTTWNLHPDNVGGLAFESESSTGTPTPSNRHYLNVGSLSIGVLVSSGALPTLTATQTAPTVLSSTTLVKVEYWHKDHLGSLAATTDHAGGVTARYAYDAFGKRRYTNGTYDAYGNVVVDWTTNTNNGTDRGYTGHEHLDDIGVIHMNGRLFDPTLGRFMQGDPLIQDPMNLQNYDRYGYCYNNPMTCVDPSGYGFLNKLFRSFYKFQKIFDPAVYHTSSRIARTKWGYTIGSIGIGAMSYAFCSSWGGRELCNAAGQATWAGYAGASFNDAARIGVVAGATTYAFNTVGTITADISYAKFWNILGHAAVGCASSVAGGGNCGNGALSAGVGAAVGNVVGYNKDDIVIGTMQSSFVGGLASLAGGGKFADGAVTSAFGYLFNYLSHEARARIIGAGALLGGTAGAIAAGGCTAGTGGVCGLGAPAIVGVGVSAGGAVGAGVANLVDWADSLIFSDSTLSPGPNAGDSIPARGPGRDFTPGERGQVNDIGNATGCHTCGANSPGTKSGNWVPDHQPPSSLNPSGQPQRLYPHCLNCSRTQGGQVRGAGSGG